MEPQTLVLAAEFTAVKIIPWHEAFTQVLKRSAHLLHEHDDNRIRAGLRTFTGAEAVPTITTGIEALRAYDALNNVVWKRPSVIRESTYHKRKRVVRFSRENVWLRDGGCCQYCGNHCARNEFTYDHVIPRSRGGKTVFNNVVVCCLADNQRKGNRTPEEAGMRLLSLPVTPKKLPGLYRRAIKLHAGMPEAWGFYLGMSEPEMSKAYWNVEIPE